jgi:hypothetical protein
MEMDLDEHCLDLVTSVNKICSVLNHKTLTSKAIHQGMQEVVAPIWHDVNYE